MFVFMGDTISYGDQGFELHRVLGKSSGFISKYIVYAA